MNQKFFELKLKTNWQKLYNFTDQTISWINENSFNDGILNLSIQHTSASLIVQENADPDVQTDLLNYFDRLVPMDEKSYIHKSEGKDDMPAHIKSALTNNQISLSVKKKGIVIRYMARNLSVWTQNWKSSEKNYSPLYRWLNMRIICPL